MNDLVRVTRPGGWIELVEVENQMKAAGPATTRLLELLLQLAGSRGLIGAGFSSASLMKTYAMRAWSRSKDAMSTSRLRSGAAGSDR